MLPNKTLETAQPAKFRGDRRNATYRHQIYLDNGIVLTGYSVSQGRNEPLNKETCLTDSVLRLIHNGYVFKAYYLAFYTNKNQGPENDDLLLELGKNGFIAHGCAQLIPRLISSLNDVYAEMRSVPDAESWASIRRELPRPRIDKHLENQLFDFKQIFRTKDDLVAHCRELVEFYRFPRGRVLAWYTCYAERNFPEVFSPVKGVDATATAGQDAINNLVHKFSVRR